MKGTKYKDSPFQMQKAKLQPLPNKEIHHKFIFRHAIVEYAINKWSKANSDGNNSHNAGKVNNKSIDLNVGSVIYTGHKNQRQCVQLVRWGGGDEKLKSLEFNCFMQFLFPILYMIIYIVQHKNRVVLKFWTNKNFISISNI